MTPLLKWAGGKRWQVPLLQQLWRRGRHKRLVEPFCGGLSVALGLQPLEAMLNDVNEDLINFHQQVRNGADLSLTPWTREAYYEHRERFNNRRSTGIGVWGAEHAALFYYLNRFGFNGLCRYNKSGEFNVPVGRGAMPARPDFASYQTIMEYWQFSSLDFEEVFLCAGDFVYCDPPYDAGFTNYAAGGFSWADQMRLASWAMNHTGPMLITNLATPRIVELYHHHGFHCYEQIAPRRISSDGDRTAVREVLATNFPIDLDGIMVLHS